MKKSIMIISIVLIGLVLLFNANSWAARDKGGPQKKWNKSANQFYKPDHGRSRAPGIQQHRPAPKLHRPDHQRAPYRFAPKWRYWWHRHRAFKNRYYGKTEHFYAPEDAFSASAMISNTGFLVSIGVSATN